MNMKIGIPKALLFFRYGVLWSSFFEILGFEVVISEDTSPQIAANGSYHSVSECCLPVKLFMGHVEYLLDKCDKIFVPRLEKLRYTEEFCVRFWGLPDIVQNTFPQADVLSFNLQHEKQEMACFISLGMSLGVSRKEAKTAYLHAKSAQNAVNKSNIIKQSAALHSSAPKVLLIAHPYLIHDNYIGTPIIQMVEKEGAIPLFSDFCDAAKAKKQAKKFSKDLYWILNQEAIGSISQLQPHIDGIILLTAFPCGTDSLVNELLLRRVHQIPMTHLVLDEQQGEAGLQTRIECFLDIIKERGRYNAS